MQQFVPSLKFSSNHHVIIDFILTLDNLLEHQLRNFEENF